MASPRAPRPPSRGARPNPAQWSAFKRRYLSGEPGFYQTVTDAIDDLLTHGYDSQQRVDDWLQRIRNAAERDMVPEAELTTQLRRTLGLIYERQVERGGALERNPGVTKFTLQQVAPRLRLELDRRIAASADLIKLNREESIQRTLRRFQGWATSLPPAQERPRAGQKTEARTELRKALTSLPFAERRVIIDQGHKLTSNINQVIATGAGAIAGEWRSNWRQAGYDYREDHKERDQRVYLIRDSWAHKQGFVKPGPAGYTDQVTQPAEEPFCFPGSSRVPFADSVEVAYRRWYSGELAELITTRGEAVRATPNHPILTSDGWRPIGSLNKGDYVFSVVREVVQPSVFTHHENNAVTTFAEIFSALREVGIAQMAGGQPQQFHGDGSDGDVDIVWSDRPLTFGMMPALQKRLNDLLLSHPTHTRTGCGTLQPLVERCLSAADRLMCGPSQSPAPILSLAGHANEARFASTPQRDIPLFKSLKEVPARNAKTLAERKQTLPPTIRHSRIIKVNRPRFSGHVYNLQTYGGWYIADGVVAGNCRCHYRYLYTLRDLPDEMITAKGRAALTQAAA